MHMIFMTQPQQTAHTATAALLTVFDVPGDLPGTGIQLETVRSQDQQPVRRDLDMMLLHQRIIHRHKTLFHLFPGNVQDTSQAHRKGEQKIDCFPGPEI